MTQFEKTVGQMKKPWAIVGFILLLVLSYLFLDRPIATYFYQMKLRTEMRPLYVITALGQWKFYIPILLGIATYFRFVAKNFVYEKKVWFILLCILVPNLLNYVLKISLSRARPELLFTYNEYGFYWFQLKDLYWSMPSGHSVTITAFAASLGLLFPRYFLLYLLVAFIVMASRVLLYYHYLSDVLAGFYMAMLAIGVIALLCRKNNWMTQLME